MPQPPQEIIDRAHTDPDSLIAQGVTPAQIQLLTAYPTSDMLATIEAGKAGVEAVATAQGAEPSIGGVVGMEAARQRAEAFAAVAPYFRGDGRYDIDAAMRAGVTPDTLAKAGFLPPDIQAAQSRAGTSAPPITPPQARSVVTPEARAPVDLVAALESGATPAALMDRGFRDVDIAQASATLSTFRVQQAEAERIIRDRLSPYLDGNRYNLTNALRDGVTIEELLQARFTEADVRAAQNALAEQDRIGAAGVQAGAARERQLRDALTAGATFESLLEGGATVEELQRASANLTEDERRTRDYNTERRTMDPIEAVQRGSESAASLVRLGYPPETAATITKLASETVRVGDGQYLPRKEWDALSTRQREYIQANGVDGLNTEIARAKDGGPDLLTALKAGTVGVDTLRLAYGDDAVTEARAFMRDNVQLGSGEWISKESYDKLTPTQQRAINLLGVSEFEEAAKLAVSPILASGSLSAYLDPERFDGFTLAGRREQALNAGFTDAQIQEAEKFNRENIRLQVGEWIPRKFYGEQTPGIRRLLDTQGVDGFSHQVAREYGGVKGYLPRARYPLEATVEDVSTTLVGSVATQQAIQRYQAAPPGPLKYIAAGALLAAGGVAVAREMRGETPTAPITLQPGLTKVGVFTEPPRAVNIGRQDILEGPQLVEPSELARARGPDFPQLGESETGRDRGLMAGPSLGRIEGTSGFIPGPEQVVRPPDMFASPPVSSVAERPSVVAVPRGVEEAMEAAEAAWEASAPDRVRTPAEPAEAKAPASPTLTEIRPSEPRRGSSRTAQQEAREKAAALAEARSTFVESGGVTSPATGQAPSPVVVGTSPVATPLVVPAAVGPAIQAQPVVTPATAAQANAEAQAAVETSAGTKTGTRVQPTTGVQVQPGIRTMVQPETGIRVMADAIPRTAPATGVDTGTLTGTGTLARPLTGAQARTATAPAAAPLTLTAPTPTVTTIVTATGATTTVRTLSRTAQQRTQARARTAARAKGAGSKLLRGGDNDDMGAGGRTKRPTYAWKQGPLWVAIKYPYRESDISYSESRPLASIAAGPKTAWNAIRRGGVGPAADTWDEFASWFAASPNDDVY